MNSTKSSKSSKSQDHTNPYDTLDHVIQGGSFILTVVEQAAQYAPVPYLQQAASSVLVIFNTIAEVKNNREDFERLAKDAVSLIAAIWDSYQKSNNKDEWPSRALRDIILDLVIALDSIVKFVESRKNKSWLKRAVHAQLDAQKISEYREKMTSAIQLFQVSSDLNVTEILLEMIKKQDVVIAHLRAATPLSPPRPHLEVPQYGYENAGPSRPPIELETLSSLGMPPRPHFTTPPHAGETTHTRAENPRGSMTVGKMSFGNVNNSGISIGGGSVSIVNG